MPFLLKICEAFSDFFSPKYVFVALKTSSKSRSIFVFVIILVIHLWSTDVLNIHICEGCLCSLNLDQAAYCKMLS